MKATSINYAAIQVGTKLLMKAASSDANSMYNNTTVVVRRVVYEGRYEVKCLDGYHAGHVLEWSVGDGVWNCEFASEWDS